MRKVQITVELPDTVGSIDQLETFIDAKGQLIKQRLFETELVRLIDQEKHNPSDSSACPACEKKVSLERAANRDS